LKSQWSTFGPISRGKRANSRNLALALQVRMNLQQPVFAYAETAGRARALSIIGIAGGKARRRG
jgi:hypothetical protein